MKRVPVLLYEGLGMTVRSLTILLYLSRSVRRGSDQGSPLVDLVTQSNDSTYYELVVSCLDHTLFDRLEPYVSNEEEK
jgi:hypothetical protein